MPSVVLSRGVPTVVLSRGVPTVVLSRGVPMVVLGALIPERRVGECVLDGLNPCVVLFTTDGSNEIQRNKNASIVSRFG